jgi:glycosyltransferase involved in cell wall biosynthesis
MQSIGLSAAVKRGFAHLTLRKTSLKDQLPANPVAIDDATDRIRLDVSSLERGLYFLSIRHDSDYPLTGPRLTAVRPEFETPDHIFTFVHRDQREFYGTVLIVDDIEALHFYPSRLPCKLEIHSCSLRRINTFARDYIYGETYVRLKSFGAAWTWDRVKDETRQRVSRWVKGGRDDSYATWWSLYGQPDEAELETQRQAVQSWGAEATPTVSIVLPVYRTPMEYLQAAVESVRAQTYPHWELCICDDASQDPGISAYLQSLAEEDQRIRVTVHLRNRHISAASNSALDLASGSFVGFLDHDDLLTPDALFQVVRVLRDRPGVDFIYSDEDVISADGRPLSPHFKPDWNLDLVRSINYVCHFLVLRRELVDACGGLREGYEGAQDFDLVLRASEVLARERIHHIPRVLYHWRAAEGSTADDVSSKPYAADAGVRALADHVARCDLPAEALHSEIPTAYRLRYQQPDPAPSVSIIIPTRNNLRVLRNCIDKLLERTDYPSFEVVVVDNRSDDPATLAYLRALPSARCRVIPYDAEFNFSALNNYAVQRCDSDVVVLLNNDTEVCNGDWLQEMVSRGGPCFQGLPQGRGGYAGADPAGPGVSRGHRCMPGGQPGQVSGGGWPG